MKFSRAAATFLDTLVAQGLIDGWTPSKVQNNSDWAAHFGTINPGTFRSRLLRIRKKYGKVCGTPRSKGGPASSSNIEPICTDSGRVDGDPFVDDVKTTRTGTSVRVDDDINEGIDVDSSSDEAVVPDNFTTFKPIYAVGYWDDPDDNDNPCASVAILNCTGVDKTADFTVNIVNERILELKVLWPECLTVSRVLHSLWLDGKGARKKLENYHGMLKSFEPMLSPLRRFDNRIESTARIPLKIKVESRPEVHLLAFFVALLAKLLRSVTTR